MRKENIEMEELYENVKHKNVHPTKNQVVGDLDYLTEMAYGVGAAGQPVTRDELVERIKEYEKTGARPISLTSVVQPRQLKRGNPFHPIKKVTQVNGMLGPDYEAAVNRQREKEGNVGDFKAQAPIGKEHVTRSILMGKNGPMIALQPRNTLPPTYYGLEASTGTYRELSEEEWKPYVRFPAPRTGAAQGISKEPEYRNYSIKNLVGLTMDKQDYSISDTEPDTAQIWQSHTT